MKLLNEMFSIVGPTGNLVNVNERDFSDVDEFTIRLNPEHIIYKAHFPNHPITPGVCIIRIIRELLELKLGVKLVLKEVKNLKFVIPVSPINDPEVTIKWNLKEFHAKGSVEGNDKIYTKFSLIFEKE